jgi:membrane AbrB-like protein
MPPASYPSKRLTTLSREAYVIGIAAVGGGIFASFGVPAAWLSGSMLLVSIVGLLKPLPDLRKPWFDSTMLLSGTLIGSAATPEALATVARYPGSIILLFVALAAIMLASGAYLRIVGRWSWIDALLASAPGALSAVIAVAEARGANIGRIAVIQLFRILVLVALLPTAMQVVGGDSLRSGPAVATDTITAAELALIMGCGIVAWCVFERIGLMAPSILGATFASATLQGTGIVHGTLPPSLQIGVLVLLGAVMGGRVSHVKRSEMKALFPLALGGFFVSVIVAFIFAWPAALLADVPYATAMAAFAPGGLEAMAMLAFAMGLDPLYVGAHHLARFMGLGLVLPILIAQLWPLPKR